MGESQERRQREGGRRGESLSLAHKGKGVKKGGGRKGEDGFYSSLISLAGREKGIEGDEGKEEEEEEEGGGGEEEDVCLVGPGEEGEEETDAYTLPRKKKEEKEE